MTLSNNRITKALIRLRRCAGWSVSLFFATPYDRFWQLNIIACIKINKNKYSLVYSLFGYVIKGRPYNNVAYKLLLKYV